MHMTPIDQSEVDLSPDRMFDRSALIQRWQHGSDAFFWRHEQAGWLRPVLQRGLLRYRWQDVLTFEGGPPAEDSDVDYSLDLMRPDQVAAICNCAPDFIMKAARNSTLPARRIGRAVRFVPGEVALWQRRQWAVRTRRVNGKLKKNSSVLKDE